ncbi:unnamed protein product [Hymenolepis diminuta]|uniref:Uncharacterized protein n=1 Tax=Hymenolepis diminuta TaxID=6216 RepID=A0A564XYN9_HYMDI|nr:unnamed protein product [Hymenolepis diminuta]
MKLKDGNLEIGRFLQVATSFVCTVRKELLNEINGDELTAMGKRKQEHCQRSANQLPHPHSLRTPEFVKRVYGMIDENPAKLIREILPNILRCLKELQYTRNVLRKEDLGCQSHKFLGEAIS